VSGLDRVQCILSRLALRYEPFSTVWTVDRSAWEGVQIHIIARPSLQVEYNTLILVTEDMDEDTILRLFRCELMDLYRRVIDDALVEKQIYLLPSCGHKEGKDRR